MTKSPSIFQFSLTFFVLIFCTVAFNGCGKASSDPLQAAKDAEIALQKGNYEKAARLFEAVATSDLATEEVFYNLGVSLHKSGKTTEAATAFRQALAQDPEDNDAKEYLAVLLHSTGNTDEAAQLLNQVLATRKKGLLRSRTLNSLALVELDAGQKDLALLHLLEAKRDSPSYAPTFFNLGHLYGKHLQLYPEAIELLERFTQIANDDEDNVAKANQSIAELKKIPSPVTPAPAAPSAAVRRLIAQGDQAARRNQNAAIRFFSQALEQDPASYDAAIKLADAELAKQDYAKALKASRIAAKNDPTQPGPIVLQANIFYSAKEYEHTLELLTTIAIPKWPEQSASYQMAAYALSQTDRRADIAPYARAYIDTARIQGVDPSDFVKWLKSFLPDFPYEE